MVVNFTGQTHQRRITTATWGKSKNLPVAGLSIAFSCTFSLIIYQQILFALVMVPDPHADLRTGLYFGGMGRATALFSVLMKLPRGMKLIVAVVWGNQPF